MARDTVSLLQLLSGGGLLSLAVYVIWYLSRVSVQSVSSDEKQEVTLDFGKGTYLVLVPGITDLKSATLFQMRSGSKKDLFHLEQKGICTPLVPDLLRQSLSSRQSRAYLAAALRAGRSMKSLNAKQREIISHLRRVADTAYNDN